ncbi:MAG: zinc-dependent alcohol dehydrogenase [Bacteroidota bacterium]
MLQAKMLEPKRIVIEEVEKPKVKPGYVLLKIGEIGVCGSDIHVYHGKHPYTPYPVIQGHEFSAEIAEIGKEVTGLKLGQLVVVTPQVTCGTCYACTHGRYNICDNLKVMGFQTEGAAREYFLVPATHIVPLPDGFERELAALIEPVAVAVHAVHRFGDVKGLKMLVLGAGPIGNLVAQVMKALGATDVAVTDLNPFRLSLAERCGLATAINVGKPEEQNRLKNYLGKNGADGILECVGHQSTIEQAIDLARKGTRIVVVGVFGAKPNVDMGLVQDRELELIGTLMYRREDYVEAINLVQKGLVQLKPLISHRFPLKKYDDAYKLIDEQPDKVMKVIINVAS